ncbi:MAG: sulfite exporter TauE/SafE family protein [Methanomassiliicoccales archaeon]|jgi:uncharacterized membrane protein YfcA
MDLVIAIGILLSSLGAGLLGSLLGLGGGIIVIPVLSLVFGFPMQIAIGASLVGVIATSTGAASYYVQEGMSNIRLGMVLETATTVGSVIGALIAVYTNQQILAVAFGILLVYASFYMVRRPERLASPGDEERKIAFVDLSASFIDKKDGSEVKYNVKSLDRGLGASLGAGALSGLLGVGGGVVQVPVMNIWMSAPMKAAAATSNFMMGITALAGAVIYYGHGLMSPVVTGLVAVGILFGAIVGSRVAHLVAGLSLRRFFAVVMVAIAILMFMKGTGVLAVV